MPWRMLRQLLHIMLVEYYRLANDGTPLREEKMDKNWQRIKCNTETESEKSPTHQRLIWQVDNLEPKGFMNKLSQIRNCCKESSETL